MGVILVTGILAARGTKAKIFIPVFVVLFILVALLFKHHVTGKLPLEF